MHDHNPLIVALDRSDRREILELVDRLRGEVGLFKVGLEAFVACGPELVSEIVGRGERVFLDLKLHDIPNTVAGAVTAAGDLGVSMLTLHTTGGRAMLHAAADAAARQTNPPMLLGVTVLTSLGSDDLEETGFHSELSNLVVRLAGLAQQTGIGGVVASPREAESIRVHAGAALTIVTPGIRSPEDANADQKRTMTPQQAIEAGANYIVVGRPITGAADPRAAAAAIVRATRG